MVRNLFKKIIDKITGGPGDAKKDAKKKEGAKSSKGFEEKNASKGYQDRGKKERGGRYGDRGPRQGGRPSDKDDSGSKDTAKGKPVIDNRSTHEINTERNKNRRQGEGGRSGYRRGRGYQPKDQGKSQEDKIYKPEGEKGRSGSGYRDQKGKSESGYRDQKGKSESGYRDQKGKSESGYRDQKGKSDAGYREQKGKQPEGKRFNEDKDKREGSNKPRNRYNQHQGYRKGTLRKKEDESELNNVEVKINNEDVKQEITQNEEEPQSVEKRLEAEARKAKKIQERKEMRKRLREEKKRKEAEAESGDSKNEAADEPDEKNEGDNDDSGNDSQSGSDRIVDAADSKEFKIGSDEKVTDDEEVDTSAGTAVSGGDEGTEGKDQAQDEKKSRNRRGRGRGRSGSKKTEVDKKEESAAADEPEEEIKDDWDASVFVVEPAEGRTRFTDLDIPSQILHALYDLKYEYATPIQADILPETLNGRDATGRAQTGTGKTAAFLIAILSKLLRNPGEQKKKGTPRALIIAPTRELVIQIASNAKDLVKYTNIKVQPVFGGMDYMKQIDQMERKLDIIVATPGRLLDFHNQRIIDLRQVEILVIDEADRMLDMGFIPDTEKIIRATPPKEKRQTLLFSATLSMQVDRLVSKWTKEPIRVEIEPEQVAGEKVEQKIYIVSSDEKFKMLYNLITKQNLDRVIVFANRRDETRVIEDKLKSHDISCAVLSGDVDQKKRIKTLDAIKEGTIRVLVATDVAARGLHIEAVSHVVNYTLPEDPEDYVHRIGRTGRAGASGISISFASEDDSFHIPAIEQFLGTPFIYTEPEEGLLDELPPPVKEIKPRPVKERRDSRYDDKGRRTQGRGRRKR